MKHRWLTHPKFNRRGRTMEKERDEAAWGKNWQIAAWGQAIPKAKVKGKGLCLTLALNPVTADHMGQHHTLFRHELMGC